MAVPKRKVSKARRDKRRSNVWKLRLPGMTKCPKCGAILKQVARQNSGTELGLYTCRVCNEK